MIHSIAFFGGLEPKKNSCVHARMIDQAGTVNYINQASLNYKVVQICCVCWKNTCLYMFIPPSNIIIYI